MPTVFLVDDDSEMRKKYSTLLKSNGIDVLAAETAVDVIDILMRDKSRIDLVLLDIQMPEVDGQGVYEIIYDYAPNIPFIVFSVLPINDQKLKVPRARGYFNKADDSSVLMQQVNNVLGLNQNAG